MQNEQKQPGWVYFVTNDGEKVLVNAEELCKASDVFASMFEVSQGSEMLVENTQDSPTIAMPENMLVLHFLARFLNGSLKSWDVSLSPQIIHDVLLAANKYCMDGLTSFLRVFVIASWSVLAKDPIALFALVDSAGWVEHRWAALKETLTLNMEDPETKVAMENTLSSKQLSDLKLVHSNRKEKLVRAVVTSYSRLPFFGGEWPGCECGEKVSCEQVIRYFRELEKVTSAIWKRPLAEFLWDRKFWRELGSDKGCLKCGATFLDEDDLWSALGDPSFVADICEQ